MNTFELYKRPQNRWKIKTLPELSAVKSLAKELNKNEVVTTLLLQRGISTAEEAKRFFNPSLTDLHDPFLMAGMERAVVKIETAISNGEKILVYGDYDVDGTTAVALFYTFLKTLNANCGFYIPDRYAEGYGISFMGIDFAKAEGYSLIVALDCGIKSNDKVDYAKELNIDFIICDHHLPGDKIPDAVAVLDPKRADCNYPYKELCGCGIGFKLAQAILQKRNLGIETITPLLDLVAVAIAADIVPLTGENRVLAYFGMQRINSTPRPGFKAMLQLEKFNKTISITDVVFILAPRINAAGRIEHGKFAVELLTAMDDAIAIAYAAGVNKNNLDRRSLDKEITTQALAMVAGSAEMQTRKSTVVFKADWHKGVVGIVASRLIEKYYRPTIVLTESNGTATGSARSVKDFDVYEAIEACHSLLIQFGGHKYAAGLTMDIKNVDAFILQFEKEVAARIMDEQLIPVIEYDMELSFENIDKDFFAEIKQFGPFGPGNMSPIFLSRKVYDRGWARVVGEKHLRMDLESAGNINRILPAIAFGKGDFFLSLANKNEMDICYSIEENEYNGKVSLQLNVKDMRTE
jgi:single-stranded-DNA-specific exonuclease